MSTSSLLLEHTQLTRVGHMDIPVPAALLGLDSEVVAGLSWAAPTWAEGGQPRIGAAVWLADIAGTKVAFDPLQALDVLLRPDRATEVQNQDAVARLLTDTGHPPESIELLVMTHIDGVGMVARRDDDGAWAPFFPNAQILLSDAELAAFSTAPPPTADPVSDIVREAWQSLIDQGCVATFRDGEAILPGLTAEVSGGHGAGHAVLHFGEPGPDAGASLIGHLAVTPLHLATGACAEVNEDPARAWELLQAVAADGRTLIGPLWPAPGCGRWSGDRLLPVDRA